MKKTHDYTKLAGTILVSLVLTILFAKNTIAQQATPTKAPPATEEKAASPQSTKSRVLLKTDMGDIEVLLYSDKAPISAANFLAYVDSGFYDGIIFHRVIPNFMAQFGGFTDNMKQRKTRAPIKNESSNGLKNKRGTLSMARTSNPDSATSQIFINVVDNASLNRRGSNAGYAVFGEVTKGMKVVDAIVNAPTKNVGFYQNVPVKPIRIIEAKRI